MKEQKKFERYISKSHDEPTYKDIIRDGFKEFYKENFKKYFPLHEAFKRLKSDYEPSSVSAVLSEDVIDLFIHNLKVSIFTKEFYKERDGFLAANAQRINNGLTAIRQYNKDELKRLYDAGTLIPASVIDETAQIGVDLFLLSHYFSNLDTKKDRSMSSISETSNDVRDIFLACKNIYTLETILGLGKTVQSQTLREILKSRK